MLPPAPTGQGIKRIAEIVVIVLAAAIPSASLAGKQEGRPVAASSFTGRVERVIDGDTIVVGTNIVRLAEIDAPEMKTPHGPASRRALSDMVLHKHVTVTWTRRGRYRRIIGQVYFDGVWINLTMVAQGWARQFRRYSRNAELAAAQRQAQSKKSGLWHTRATALKGRSRL